MRENAYANLDYKYRELFLLFMSLSLFDSDRRDINIEAILEGFIQARAQ